MPDQFVKVTFPADRTVRVDGQDAGFTNREFQVETGQHRFDLGEPRDYFPDQAVETISGTLPGQPRIIVFVRAS